MTKVVKYNAPRHSKTSDPQKVQHTLPEAAGPVFGASKHLADLDPPSATSTQIFDFPATPRQGGLNVIGALSTPRPTRPDEC